MIMVNCENCKNLLLDYVYDLLDESEAQELREHLQACSECKAALETALTQQNFMARAARAIPEVPEFSLPSDEPATVPQSPATLPLSLESAPQRSLWRRPWVVWSAAAAILIAVSLSISAYRTQMHARQDDLTAARQKHKLVDEQFAALPAKYETLQKAELQKLHAKAGAYLHVVGPKELNAKGHLHITTRKSRRRTHCLRCPHSPHGGRHGQRRPGHAGTDRRPGPSRDRREPGEAQQHAESHRRSRYGRGPSRVEEVDPRAVAELCRAHRHEQEDLPTQRCALLPRAGAGSLSSPAAGATNHDSRDAGESEE